ncbi:MAG: hypothetical protein HYT09_00610 [Candidatus Levybacteria bacterium]|nr:hypothetical protein [Candidatus Levybacteria bacterium]
MHRLNLLFTLSSLSVLLVTIERFSFTTQVFLQPYNFLRLHELVQMIIIILFTVIIPALLLREVTQNFSSIKQKEFLLILTFIVGVYFYATGNGVHEIGSFFFNNYCDVSNFSGNICGGFFINDYYLGNILYFVGGFMMISALLLLEYKRPNKTYAKKDLLIMVINAVVYAFAIFAYAAFDRVLVGLVYSIITTIFAVYLFMLVRKKYLEFPVITYTALTYSLGTITAVVFKLLR